MSYSTIFSLLLLYINMKTYWNIVILTQFLLIFLICLDIKWYVKGDNFVTRAYFILKFCIQLDFGLLSFFCSLTYLKRFIFRGHTGHNSEMHMCLAAILDFWLPSIPHRRDFWRFYVFMLSRCQTSISEKISFLHYLSRLGWFSA